MDVYWTRVAHDTYLHASPFYNSEIIGKMLKTYGVKVLETTDQYAKVFSPDLNCNGYIELKYLKEGVE